MDPFSLEPERAQMAMMANLILDEVMDFIEELPDRPVNNDTDPRVTSALVTQLLSPPSEMPGDMAALLGQLRRATDYAIDTASPGCLAYVPSSGLYTSALGEFYARAVNRFGALAFAAPALTAMEEGVLRWMAQEVCGLPTGSTGLLTTGGSMAALSAVIAARHHHLGEDIADGTVYVSPYTHHSIAKAARLAGIKARNIRIVSCTPDLRMDLTAAAELIRADRQAGLRPFLLVGSAGTTDTGTVDPLYALADLAERERVWFHVDGAYGGFFRLTERGREQLSGIESADSVTLDPHKTLFLPFGTGALVVRDPARLAAAHEGSASYLRDISSSDDLPDYAQLGPELSRENRGLRVWLPLHLHGVSAFRAALDEKLDLAGEVYDALSDIPTLEVPLRPDLSTVVFRVRPLDWTSASIGQANIATQQLLEQINGKGRVLLSSTIVGGRQTIRICVLGHRTHSDRISELLDLIRSAHHC
jgi:aromatic-L-amino-acid/L-tryptophan decarboxylase